jgi:hypothetical protein
MKTMSAKLITKLMRKRMMKITKITMEKSLRTRKISRMDLMKDKRKLKRLIMDNALLEIKIKKFQILKMPKPNANHSLLSHTQLSSTLRSNKTKQITSLARILPIC